MPSHLHGHHVKARRDAATVKIYFRGELVKLHPRVAPGKRSTDVADYPEGTSLYATRDVAALRALAGQHGSHVERFATAVLDTALPWTKMRQVYRLVGLAKKWGPERLNEACRRALDAESCDVNLVARMLERARESASTERPFAPITTPGRFARDPGEFATREVSGS